VSWVRRTPTSSEPEPRPAGSARRQNTGFALIIVLWTLVLIAFLVAQITASGRSEVRIAQNLVANAVVEAAADGAIARAIFAVTDPRPDRRWAADGLVHHLTIGDCRIELRVQDEAGRINPNSASPALLEALLRALGDDPATASRIAASIAEWVGSAPDAQLPDRLLAKYRAAGLDYGPPGEPLETLDELERVLGVTPALMAELRPHLTLYGPPEPNRAAADPVVSAAIARLAPPVASAAAPAPAATLRLTALAAGRGNAETIRTAIIRIDPTLPEGYLVLSWRGGEQ
jgi:general secretion pathway protein K